MSAFDKHGEQRPGADGAGDQRGGGMPSLTRTLEDLEARLTRLSSARREPASDEPAIGARGVDHPPETSPTARLRAEAQRRLNGSSGLALKASGTGETASVRRSNPVLDRRIGTIAGEVEALKLQGATLQVVTSIADELQVLRNEVTDTIAAASEISFGEIRESFEDLRDRIDASDHGDAIGEQMALIMRRLTDMQASGLERGSLDRLRTDLERVKSLVSETAREDTMLHAARRWEDFEARLEAHVELDGAAKRDLQVELERLRSVVRSLATEDQVRAVEKRWDEFEVRHFEKLRTETEGQLGRIIRAELETLGARIDALTECGLTAEIEAREERGEREAAGRRVDDALSRLGSRFDQLEEAVVSLPSILGVDRLEERLQALSHSVELVMAAQSEPDLEHFVLLEERLDEISEAIVASSLREEPAMDMAPIERIEARVADLAARMERLAAHSDTEILSARIAELSMRMEELAARGSGEAGDERLEIFSQRVEAALARIEQPNAQSMIFDERLSILAERLEAVAAAQVDEDVLRSLEAQITRLGTQLSGQDAGQRADVDLDVERRLTSLEMRLEENRAEVMAAARSAADEAVRLMQANGAGAQSDHVRGLSDDLRSLEMLCRETDERSIKVFEAVHTTLVKIAERLATIEDEVRGDATAATGASSRRTADPVERLPELEVFAAGARAEHEAETSVEDAPQNRGLRAAITRHLGRAPSRAKSNTAGDVRIEPEAPSRIVAEAPPLDAEASILSREANRPLEPGSGAPDIASLIDRVRAQQLQQRIGGSEAGAKADFIAAARKAAQAAAAEAESLRQEEDERSSEGQAEEGTGRRAGRHRKPILMAVGAVLLAIMAIPLGRVVVDHMPAEAEREIARLTAQDAETLPVPTETASTPALDTQTQTATVAPVTAPAPVELAAAPAPELAPAPVGAPAEATRSAADRPSIAALAAERASGFSDRRFQTSSLVSQASMGPAMPAPLAETPAVAAVENAASEPVAVAAQREDDAEVLASALARLPETARGELPEAPAGIGSPELLAAASDGDVRAIFEIGLRIMEGAGGEAASPDAISWFAAAARLGYAPAQYSLGTLFEKGNGVERNTGAARDWYLLSAERGNVRAMHNLAVLYATGVDGISEPQNAARWFTAAAEHGMRDSQYNLGILHARGAGVAQDFAQSYKWFSIVGSEGDRDALEKRDEVAKTLSAEQIASLDAEIAAFVPKPRDEAVNTLDLPAEWSLDPAQTASVDKTRAIRNVQAILIKLGFDPGAPDGVVGAKTTEAVRAFQTDAGLEVTGLIDETLVRKLLERNV